MEDEEEVIETNEQEQPTPEQIQAETLKQTQLQEQMDASNNLLKEQCKYLLSSALSASRLPEVTQSRLRKSFEGTVFQPAQLQIAIDEAKKEVSELTGSLAVHGPARITGMFNTEDQLQMAFEDLFGIQREKGKENVKVARLQGIREAYLMLTGDYDFHGGFDPVRAMLATTADFTGLVKNALNKIIVSSFETVGRAGYDWWKAIVKVEHFNSLTTSPAHWSAPLPPCLPLQTGRVHRTCDR